MATRYWVGGSGTWNGSSTTNWSATSGGPSGASAPTSADDVIFNTSSSGASYVVTCSTTATCKSIQTTPPSTGTLTFSAVSVTFFSVVGGDINIHSGCLFTNRGYIYHSASGIARTYTTIFNTSTTNTTNILYQFTSSTSGDNLNFCLSESNTFTSVTVSMTAGNSFVCTGSTINTVGDPASANAVFGVYGSYTSVNLGSSTINVAQSGLATYNAFFQLLSSTGDTATTLTMPSTVRIGNAASSSVSIGNISYAPAISTGTVIVSGGATCAITANNLNALTCEALSTVTLTKANAGASGLLSNTLTLTGGSITVQENYTFSAITGTTSTNGPSFKSTGYSITVNGAVNMTGSSASSINAVVDVSSSTFNGAVTITERGAFYFDANISLTNSLTFSPTGTGRFDLIGSATITSAQISMTNTNVSVPTMIVNGGAGKTFAYTLDANATNCAFNSGSLTVSTPTCSIVGTTAKRVIFSAGTFTRTGSAPTLTNVTFVGTVINGGATNYSGTRLGTDGISTGFLPETPVNWYLVAGATASWSYEGAIWATTSGGAGTTNVPLPQDSIVIDNNSSSVDTVITSSAAAVTSIYAGTVTDIRSASTRSITISPASGGYFNSFGSLISTNTNTTAGRLVITDLYMLQSGNTNRYLTNNSGSMQIAANANLFVGASSTLTIGGTNSPSFGATNYTNNWYFGGGTYIMQDGIVFNSSGVPSLTLRYFYLLSGANVSGYFEFKGTHAIFQSGVTMTNSNYVLSFFRSTGFFQNQSVTTARNGTININEPTGSFAIYANSTSAANPLVALNVPTGVSGFSGTILFTGDVYLQNLSVSATTSPSAQSVTLAPSGVSNITMYKTNGGTVRFPLATSNVTTTVNNVLASPANTFYTTGTRTGTTTGWNAGSPPASPPSGNFLML